MAKAFKIGEQSLAISTISEIITKNTPIVLSVSAKKKIQACRKYLDNKIEKSSDPIYGINTGFGSLCNHTISNKELSKLQKNLVLSHACGTGEEVPPEIVRIMLLLKVQALASGYSGVQLITVQRLVEMFNNKIPTYF